MIDKMKNAETEIKRPNVKPTSRWKRAILRWLVWPAIAVATIVAVGAHLGANGPDRWYTQLVRWVADLLLNLLSS
jgi:hypothetical protein